jgi:hypothetical protein
MLRWIAALLLAAAAATAASAAQTPEADPLSSRECAAARDELERALAESAALRQSHPERLSRARQQAARSCLGRDHSERQRSGAPYPAVVIPPAASSARAVQPSAPAIAPEPPPPVPRAATITVCDPAGCWDSEGRRLNNMGPLLVGPRGLCTLQGGLLNCP